MARMNELEEENRRLKKTYVEERQKAKSLRRRTQKNGSAISTAGGGAMGRVGAVSRSQAGVPGIWHQPTCYQYKAKLDAETTSLLTG